MRSDQKREVLKHEAIVKKRKEVCRQFYNAKKDGRIIGSVLFQGY